MIEAQIPVDEPERLQALQALGILYSPAEERFDRITRIARHAFRAPMSLISLIASDVQWFKSAQGISVCETPRRIAFCAHAILQPGTFVVPDATQDRRFADNPAVTGEPGVRFYAGQPLLAEGGYAIGTLCVIDRVPRDTWSEEDSAILRDLALIAQAELRVHRVADERDLLNAERELLSGERDELRRHAMLDALTRVWNRDAFLDASRRELGRALRSGKPVVIALVGVDLAAGGGGRPDTAESHAVLREVAQRVRGALRGYDVLGRLHAGLFAVLLPECDMQEGRKLAGRMRQAVTERPVDADGRPVPVTTNIGLARADPGVELEHLLAMAEEALRRSGEPGAGAAGIDAPDRP